MPENRTLSVSQLNMYVRLILEGDENLRRVSVRGEISNYVHHRSGHLYMTLKDSEASIKAVMFRTAAQRLTFEPREGMTVTAIGGVSVFERDGVYQLYIDSMLPSGQGAEYLRFMQLKEKLDKLGIFDSAHKRPLPRFPQAIGLITSPTGAAVKDVLAVLGRRYPQGQILFYPCKVQGEGAAASVKKGIEYFNANCSADVIIVTRGGGSAEDLSAFNDEGLAYAAYNSAIPIISAVGHEIDYTILDFTADVRCPTPSAAAECVSPDNKALQDELYYYTGRINSLIAARLSTERLRLSNAVAACDISDINAKRELYLKALSARTLAAQTALIAAKQKALAALAGKLSALSPLNTLARGYASVTANGIPVTSVTDIKTGDGLQLRLKDGEVYCHAEKIII